MRARLCGESVTHAPITHFLAPHTHQEQKARRWQAKWEAEMAAKRKQEELSSEGKVKGIDLDDSWRF